MLRSHRTRCWRRSRHPPPIAAAAGSDGRCRPWRQAPQQRRPRSSARRQATVKAVSWACGLSRDGRRSDDLVRRSQQADARMSAYVIKRYQSREPRSSGRFVRGKSVFPMPPGPRHEHDGTVATSATPRDDAVVEDAHPGDTSSGSDSLRRSAVSRHEPVDQHLYETGDRRGGQAAVGGFAAGVLFAGPRHRAGTEPTHALARPREALRCKESGQEKVIARRCAVTATWTCPPTTPTSAPFRNRLGRRGSGRRGRSVDQTAALA